MWYTLNLHRTVCQLNRNKTGEGGIIWKNIKQLVVSFSRMGLNYQIGIFLQIRDNFAAPVHM